MRMTSLLGAGEGAESRSEPGSCRPARLAPWAVLSRLLGSTATLCSHRLSPSRTATQAMLQLRQQWHRTQHKSKPLLITSRTRQTQKTGSSRAEHDKAGSAHGHCVDIGHFCNYLYTLYHILNVDVQGQASSTSCHKGHKHPSCQHSSGGVSVLFLINPILQPWPCTSVQQPHGGYLVPYHCVVMLLAQPDSVMSRPAHPPVLCSPSLQSSRICSPTVFLAIAHSPAQRLTAGRAWHRLVCPLQPAAWPSQPCSQHSACSKAPGVVGQLSTEQELRVPRLPGGTGVCDSQQLQPRDLQAAAGFCLILHH